MVPSRIMRRPLHEVWRKSVAAWNCGVRVRSVTFDQNKHHLQTKHHFCQNICCRDNRRLQRKWGGKCRGNIREVPLSDISTINTSSSQAKNIKIKNKRHYPSRNLDKCVFQDQVIFVEESRNLARINFCESTTRKNNRRGKLDLNYGKFISNCFLSN